MAWAVKTAAPPERILANANSTEYALAELQLAKLTCKQVGSMPCLPPVTPLSGFNNINASLSMGGIMAPPQPIYTRSFSSATYPSVPPKMNSYQWPAISYGDES